MYTYPPQVVLAHRMEANLHRGDVSWVVELHISEGKGKDSPVHPDVQYLLDRYSIVFEDIPLGRPPNRGFEHTIELEQGV